MIWLEVKYTPEVVTTAEGVSYRVTAEVVSAGGIDREVFVHRTVDEVYMHPALVYDLRTWPGTRAEAVGAGADFYRKTSAVQVFSASASAAAALRVFKGRLRALVTQWKSVQTENLGLTEVEVYTSE